MTEHWAGGSSGRRRKKPEGPGTPRHVPGEQPSLKVQVGKWVERVSLQQIAG